MTISNMANLHFAAPEFRSGISEGLPVSVYHTLSQEVEEEPYWAWLCSIPGLYLPMQLYFMRLCKDPCVLWECAAAKMDLEEVCTRVVQNQTKQTESEQNKANQNTVWQLLCRYAKELPVAKLWEYLQSQRIRFVSIRNPSYPPRLRPLGEAAPLGLFYRGALPDPHTGAAAIVGARVCSRYGKEMAELIARTVAQAGGVVVSGAACGIDGAAQMEALRQGGFSLAVLGSSVDQPYPKSNQALFDKLEEQGGYVSEFPPGTPAQKFHFPLRNRLISALSDVTVVVEAKKKSGSLITANYAAEQGKDVYAVPGRCGDALCEGCNELIAQGAGIFQDVQRFYQDVLIPLGLEKRKDSVQDTLAPEEKLVYSSLNFRAIGVEELSMRTGIPISRLLSILMGLEMKGLAGEVYRNSYCKK